jgi:hypothetical protein
VLYRSIVGAYHFSSEYVTYALLAAPRSLPAAKAAVWIASWFWVPGLELIVFLALLFPSGQLPSPRWRPFAWLSVPKHPTTTLVRFDEIGGIWALRVGL